MPRHAVPPNGDLLQPIRRPHSRTPMHARNTARQQNPTHQRLPPRIRPSGSIDEEQEQGDRAGGDGDDARADDVARPVDAGIVGDGGVAEVVHSADGAAGEDAGTDDAGQRVVRVGADGDEGDDEDDDGDEEGDGGYAGCVGDLESFLAVGEDDG